MKAATEKRERNESPEKLSGFESAISVKRSTLFDQVFVETLFSLFAYHASQTREHTFYPPGPCVPCLDQETRHLLSNILICMFFLFFFLVSTSRADAYLYRYALFFLFINARIDSQMPASYYFGCSYQFSLQIKPFKIFTFLEFLIKQLEISKNLGGIFKEN